MASKPTEIPRWATLGVRTDPGAAKKDTGWVIPEPPPDTFFNWLFGVTGDWVTWLDERLFDSGGGTGFTLTGPTGGASVILSSSTQTASLGGTLGANLTFDGDAQVTVLANEVLIGQEGADLAVQDVDFRMLIDTGNPTVHFDALNLEGLRYDRTNNILNFLGTGGTSMIQLDHDTARFAPTITNTGSLGGTAPTQRWANLFCQDGDFSVRVESPLYEMNAGLGMNAATSQPNISRYDRTPNNSPIVVAQASGAGAAFVSGWNLASVVRNSVGNYTVTLTEGTGILLFGSIPVITAITDTTPGFVRGAFLTATTIGVNTYDTAGALADRDFSVVAYG